MFEYFLHFMDVTVKIEVYDGLHFLNLDVILDKCVGGTDLIQWKQGNTWSKSVLKDLSLRDLFFCELLEKGIKSWI